MRKRRLAPKNDWVLIEEIPQEYVGKIAVADYYGLTHEMLLGKVLAVGPGRKVGNRLVEMELKPGDQVVFHRKGREILRLDMDGDGLEEPYLMVKESRIDAVLEES